MSRSTLYRCQLSMREARGGRSGESGSAQGARGVCLPRKVVDRYEIAESGFDVCSRGMRGASSDLRGCIAVRNDVKWRTVARIKADGAGECALSSRSMNRIRNPEKSEGWAYTDVVDKIVSR